MANRQIEDSSRPDFDRRYQRADVLPVFHTSLGLVCSLLALVVDGATGGARYRRVRSLAALLRPPTLPPRTRM